MYVCMYVCMYAGSCYTPEVTPYSRNMYVRILFLKYVRVGTSSHIYTYIHTYICTYLGICYQVGYDEPMMCRSLVRPRGGRRRRCHREAIHQELKFDSLVHRIPDRIHFLPWPILVHFVISFLPSFLPSLLLTRTFIISIFFKSSNKHPKSARKQEKKRCDQFSILFKALFLRT